MAIPAPKAVFLTRGNILFVLVASAAVFFQYVVRPIQRNSLGYGRELEDLTSFDARCRKIDAPESFKLGGCDDMWVNHKSGHYYMACGDPEGRKQWDPNNNKLNATGRSLRDRFAILESRNPAPYREKLKWITPIFPNGTETPPLNFQGFDILVDEEDSEKLHIIVVNHRPSLDPATGALLDQEKVGPNSTFEYFETLVGNDTMVHKRTFVHSSIRTPSHIAWVDKNLFLFTNTHDSKVRSSNLLSPYNSKGGSVGYCTPPGKRCRILPDVHPHQPNGLLLGSDPEMDRLVFIPSSTKPIIQVYSITTPPKEIRLKREDTVELPMPAHGISMDYMGNIWAALQPKRHKYLDFLKGTNVTVPSSVYKIIKLGPAGQGDTGGWNWYQEKVIEDNGTTMPITTSAVFDAVGERLILGGGSSPYVTECSTGYQSRWTTDDDPY